MVQLRPKCKTLLEAITLDKNQRQAIPTHLTKNEKKKMSGQNIDYHKLNDQHKSLVDKSRAEEWKKWMDFGAAVPLQTKVIDELLQRGHGLIPTQWLDVDKDLHLQRPGKHISLDISLGW